MPTSGGILSVWQGDATERHTTEGFTHSEYLIS